MSEMIDAKSASEGFEAGKIQLIDVRTPAEYGSLHIEGTLLMPLGSIDVAKVKEMGSDKSCVIVCQSGKRAAQACAQLKAAGCENVRVMEGGVMAWNQAGLPVNRGQSVISLERQVRIAAGLLVVVSVGLGAWVHPGFLGMTAFVGLGLTFAGLTDWCGMALLMAKAPWNQRSGIACEGKSCSV